MASFAGVSLETKTGGGSSRQLDSLGDAGAEAVLDGRSSIVDCRSRTAVAGCGYGATAVINRCGRRQRRRRACSIPARSRLDPGSFPVPRRPRPLRPSCPAIGCMYERRASQGPAPGGLNSGGDDSSPERDSYEQTFLVTFRSLVGSRYISFIHTHCEPRDRQRSPFRLRPSFELSLVAHARGTRILA